MSLQIQQMMCCAFCEISGLEEIDSPKKSMQELCQNIWPDRRVEYGDRVKPSAFYIFNGVVGTRPDSEEDDYYELNDAIEDFASFIKKNRLGTMVAGPTRYNRRNEPDHKVKGYIWAPNEEALWKWYQENREDKEEYEARVKDARVGRDNYAWW